MTTNTDAEWSGHSVKAFLVQEVAERNNKKYEKKKTKITQVKLMFKCILVPNSIVLEY